MRVKNTILVKGKRKTCRIFDAGPDVWDRYTIAFRAQRVRGQLFYPYISASTWPYYSQGFGQHGESKFFMTGRHLGKRITFETCPPDVQRFIIQNI